MAEPLLEMAKDLTQALIEAGNLALEDMNTTLQKTYATLTTLKSQEELVITPEVPTAATVPADWRKSIMRYSVTCLECGRIQKQLSRRHLEIHGLDAQSYRMKYRIPRTQPLSAKETTARRRTVVQETRPWEQAPTYIKGQGNNGHTAPAPVAEALPDEIEAPTAVVSAQPKRQRKTAAKKTTAGQKNSRG